MKEKKYCSFCGKTEDKVKRLISGQNGACICDECIEICGDMVRDLDAESLQPVPLKKPAVIFALEKLCAAFNDLKFNAVFQGLLYDFILNVVKENKKWQKLSA